MKFIHAQDIKSHFRIAVLINFSATHDYSDLFVQALVERLQELDFSDEYMTVVTSSSPFDFPLIAYKLSMTKEYSAILATAFIGADQADGLSLVEAQLLNIGIQSQLPNLLQKFYIDGQDPESIKSAICQGARELAERAYSVVSVVGQID